MLLLLLLPILTAGFYICKKSPFHYYRLHRYEGQMLYLQSASIGLICLILAYVFLVSVNSFIPSTICTYNINIEAFLIELTKNSLNVDDEQASMFTWIFLLTVGILSIAYFWTQNDQRRLNRLSKKHDVDARIILMGNVLADSPLDALLFESYVYENIYVMLTLSNRKVYVGVVNNMGEPNEVEGFDQEISLVPILSGYRDKDDLSVHWTTSYQEVDPDEDLRIVIRQELIESGSEFDFDTWEAFSTTRKERDKKIKVTFNPKKNSFSWTLT